MCLLERNALFIQFLSLQNQEYCCTDLLLSLLKIFNLMHFSTFLARYHDYSNLYLIMPLIKSLEQFRATFVSYKLYGFPPQNGGSPVLSYLYTEQKELYIFKKKFLFFLRHRLLVS